MRITITPGSPKTASKGLLIYLVMSTDPLEAVRGPPSLVSGRHTLQERQRTLAPRGQFPQCVEPLLVVSDLLRFVPDDQVPVRGFQEEHIVSFGIRELEDHEGT